MSKRHWALAGFVLLAGCISPPTRKETTTPRNVAVNSCATLVAVAGRTGAEGLAAQDRWLAKHHPGARRIADDMTSCAGTPTERVTFRVQDVTYDVLFDVSAYFGKVDGTDLDDLLDG